VGWPCSAYGEKRVVYRAVVRKPEVKVPLARPRHRWQDNIKMDLQECDVGVWSGWNWLRIGTGGGTCVCGNTPSGSIKCGELVD
jgi:hypothetical protein